MTLFSQRSCRALSLVLSLALICFVGSFFGGPVAGVQAQQQTQRPTSTPYKGDLSIFDYPDRGNKLQINRVMDILGIGPNKIVADIGAGSGWFTEQVARRVGTGGRVFSEDINPDAIEHIADRMKKDKIDNVRTILGQPDDPMLPQGAVDAVLLLKVYHEIAKPVAFMQTLKRALAPECEGGDHRPERERRGSRAESECRGAGDGRRGLPAGGALRLH